jgi:hypothetical protein
LSTTLLTKITGISLHMQWPLTLKSQGKKLSSMFPHGVTMSKTKLPTSKDVENYGQCWLFLILILWNSWTHFRQSNQLKQNVSKECISRFGASLYTKWLHQKYQAK